MSKDDSTNSSQPNKDKSKSKPNGSWIENPPPENIEVKKARIGMWQAIVVAFITTIGGGLFGYFAAKSNDQNKTKSEAIVSIGDSNLVTTLPNETNADDYTLLKDISIFDLRQWKSTPSNLIDTRYSAADYTNYLHFKKTKPVDSIVIHYSTTGYTIDLRCITNDFKFYQKAKPEFHDGKQSKEFALIIDVTNVDVGQEALIVIEATYWNGFNNLDTEDVETYTDTEIHGLNELGLIVLFPESKPFKDIPVLLDIPNNGIEKHYRGLNDTYNDEKKKFIYWSIKQRIANHHYKLKWQW